MLIKLRLFLARFFWLKGKPPRHGSFLLVLEGGEVKYQFLVTSSPESVAMPIIYWKRVNSPIPAPIEYLTYNPKAREEAAPSFRSYR